MEQRLREKAGVVALQVAAALRNKHEVEEHDYHHAVMNPTTVGPFNSSKAKGFKN